MSCASEKKLLTRAEHSKTKNLAEDLSQLIQLQPRAVKKMALVAKDHPDPVFRVYIEGFG